jgi:hypothetical protein
MGVEEHQLDPTAVPRQQLRQAELEALHQIGGGELADIAAAESE